MIWYVYILYRYIYEYLPSANKQQWNGPKRFTVFNIRRTKVGNNIVDHSYVVGALLVGAAPTASSSCT